LLSIFIKTPEYKSEEFYDWQKPEYNPDDDEFMKQFDENGNFAPIKLEEINLEDTEKTETNFVYDFIQNPTTKK